MANYIETPILPLSVSGWAFREDANICGWLFCTYDLHKHFDFPKNAKRIQFRAYPKPGPGRTKVTFKSRATCSNVIIEEVNDDILPETMRAIKKLIGKTKTWYVELYYWTTKK